MLRRRTRSRIRIRPGRREAVVGAVLLLAVIAERLRARFRRASGSEPQSAADAAEDEATRESVRPPLDYDAG